MKIHYLGFLTKKHDNSWIFCSNPNIVAITENNALFLNTESIQQIISVTGAYINQYCPKATRFEFDARNTLAEIEQSKIFSIKRVTKNKSSGNWVYNPRYAKNYAMQKATQKEREKLRKQKVKEHKRLIELQKSARKKQRLINKAQHDYNDNALKLIFSRRLAYLYDLSELTDPYSLMAKTVLSDGPAQGILLVNINSLDGDIATTEWPFSLKIDGIHDNITSKGWYIIKGELQIDDIQHKNEQGLPQSVFFLENAIQCEMERCQEANDLEKVIRHKYDLPDWEPNGNN